MEYLIEAPQELPVIDEYDVLVLGGGPAGISAAIAASRIGAKTAIIERYGYLGGQATGGLVILLVGLTDGKKKIIRGICEEVINKLKIMKAAEELQAGILFDPEAMKLVFDSFIQENNITPYYHSFVSNVIAAENWVSGVVIEGKSGRNVIKSKVFIDATGDADLAKYCRIPFQQENKTLPVTLGFRVGGINVEKVFQFTAENRTQYQKLMENLGISTQIGGWIKTLHNKEAWFNIAHVENIDATNTRDLTKAEIQARKNIFEIIENFKKHIPGFEEGYLIDTAPQMGIRDSRRIKGLYYFTKDDITKKFSDSIAKAPDYTGSGQGSIEIPFRCLVSKKVENIIFCGRCISIDHELFNLIREIPCCMATGQAAGAAAGIVALKDQEQDYIKKIDINLLRKTLIEQGAIIMD
ncbi:MAG: FAD-dependent oxidoreductase [bacterium]